MNMSSSENGASVDVILVHGTWGRGKLVATDKPWWGAPFWFDKNSEFRKRLEASLEERKVKPRIECVNWSGANSVFARAKAADELGRILAAAPRDVPQIVIAHSHAGNIALRALKDVDTSRIRVYVATLATPFLRIFDVTAPPYFFFFISVFVVMLCILRYSPSIPFSLLTGALSILLMIFGDPSKILGNPSGNVDPPTWLLLVAAAVIGLFAVAIFVFCKWFVRIYFNPGSSDNLSTTWIRRPFSLAEATNFDPTPKSIPLLVIRGVGDEASLAMAAGKIGARLNSALSKIIFWIAFCVVLVGDVGSHLLVSFHLAKPSLQDYVSNTFFLLMIIFAASCLLPNLFNIVFGREFLLGTVRCEVSADAVPDGASARVVTLKPSDAVLRHFIYDHPQCVTAIVQWLENESVIPEPADLASPGGSSEELRKN
jgi:hypothetical protein